MNVAAPPQIEQLANKNYQRQVLLQFRLLPWAEKYMAETERGTCNLVATQQIANIATAAGLGGQLNYHA